MLGCPEQIQGPQKLIKLQWNTRSHFLQIHLEMLVFDNCYKKSSKAATSEFIFSPLSFSAKFLQSVFSFNISGK